ncbi:MAG: alkaline phosphatase family protein [Bacteroidetes bacterium]|nr:alkaline phosphatase family protein [Bacteroidota bacterium]
MKKILILIFSLCFRLGFSQAGSGTENIIVVTTDGFRWQEVFGGMDSLIAVDSAFNQNDMKGIFKNYWAFTQEERRKALMPFLWGTMERHGQIYGNRKYHVDVDNANPYWFSYPGYSEIFCGYVDTAINSNKYPPNPHTNVLEYINHQPGFAGKVSAFCAWDAFDRILNEERSGFPVTCGAEMCGGKNPDVEEKTINALKADSYLPFGEEEYEDVYTHYMAMDYLQKKKPRVLYISYGETDEWAHAGHYKDYLDAAHRVDKWLGDLWNFIQTDPQYKNRTALFVTVDHGRGDRVKEKWTSHNNKIEDSHQIWFAVMGPGIPAKGEIKTPVQIYQKQFAETIAEMLGLQFKCEHPVADGLKGR